MRLTWLVAIFLTLSLAFAGCTGGDDNDTDADGGDGDHMDDGDDGDHMDDGDDGDHMDDGDDGDSGNESGENTPPSLGMNVAPSEGGAPLEVSFDLSAEDADGDALTWTLDVDADGTAEAEGTGDDLPTNYTHTFETEGNYTANFTVDDGSDEASVTQDITVTAGGGGGGEVPGPENINTAGLRPDPTVVAGANGCPDSSLGKGSKPVDTLIGWTFANDGGDGAVRLEFRDADAALVGEATTVGAGGTVPEGAVTAWVCNDDPTAAPGGLHPGLNAKVKLTHPDYVEA